MSEFSKAFHGGDYFQEVKEVKAEPQQPQINPNLMAEAQRINAGKVINVAELDKPITMNTLKKELRILSFTHPELVTKELRDEVLAQVEAMRVQPLRPFETQEGRNDRAEELKKKVERAYEDRSFNAMVFAQDDLLHSDCFGI